MTATDALYVYGVVPSGTAPDDFADVAGMDPQSPIALVESGDVAAITSVVPLAEFGADELDANLKDPAWLEQKVQTHNQVLAAALRATTVVPFRFGTIYRGEEHVTSMLAQRSDLGQTLSRLRGKLELGVKALLDVDVLRTRLSPSAVRDPAVGAGRTYLVRKQLERQLEEDVRAFAASCAEESHTRLAAVAEDARTNPAQHPSVAGGEMLLNGAYLVASERERDFRTAVQELQDRFGADGVAYELTGPWPPYNFVAEEASA